MRELLGQSLFFEVSALLVLAAGIGFIGHLLRQPLIVSFIAVGVVAGPSILDIKQSAEKIALLSELGIAVLGKLIDNVNQSSTDIAHDLKKPMTRLRQRLEAALDADPEPVEIKAVLQRSLDEIDGIVATFDALLNIGQLEAGGRRARFTDVDLAEVIRTVVEAYEAVIQDTGFRLQEPSISAKGVEIHGDSELLTQLFANLIENVLRHCPVGTTISVSLSVDPARVTATVADNGPGIPAAERENVFRRFYRLERARSGPGHGLGLNLVAAIADLHGAAITLEDNEPGLRVAIAFPRKLG